MYSSDVRPVDPEANRDFYDALHAQEWGARLAAASRLALDPTNSGGSDTPEGDLMLARHEIAGWEGDVLRASASLQERAAGHYASAQYFLGRICKIKE